MLQTSFNKKYTLYVNFDRAKSDGCMCVCVERGQLPISGSNHFKVPPSTLTGWFETLLVTMFPLSLRTLIHNRSLLCILWPHMHKDYAYCVPVFHHGIVNSLCFCTFMKSSIVNSMIAWSFSFYQLRCSAYNVGTLGCYV